MLHAFGYLLCFKLCWHNQSGPTNGDFKDAAPYLFGENFGAQAKERLEAAEALKKVITSDRGQQRGFQRSHPQRNSGRGDGSQFSGCAGGSRGW